MSMLPLPKKRDLFFTKQFDQESVSALTRDIIDVNRDDEHLKKVYSVYGMTYTPEPIKIYIDSYGGAVYQAFGLISIIEKSETPVHTIVTGCAMSCGFLLLISGHKRFAHKLSTPLYHQVSTRFTGKLKDMEEDIEETKRLQKEIEKLTKERTKISKKTLKEVFDGKRDWFMSANEALELGVVDGII